jgi:hypothetical protein
LSINRPDPIDFMPVAVDTAGRINDDFSRLLFLHAHREASVLAIELPEESEPCFTNIKGSVGLILAKLRRPWVDRVPVPTHRVPVPRSTQCIRDV